MPNAPEQEARARIDAQLAACGWAVQDFRKADFSAGRGIALREVRLKSGPCDYLLLVDRKPVGVVEAKKQGTKLSIIADQSTHPLITSNMRDCQIEAIEGLEKSFARAHPRALIHMATGAGKTFTACAFIYQRGGSARHIRSSERGLRACSTS